MIVAALLAAVAALVAARAARRLQPRHRSDVAIAALRRPMPVDHAALLDAIARQVRSGRSLTAAVLEEIDGDSRFDNVAASLAGGSSLGDALAAMPLVDADDGLTVQALSAAAQLGGPVAATLDSAAAVLRERAAARAERLAQSAQARFSARVMTIVPLGFAAWSAISNAATRHVYVTNAVAGVSATAGIALNVAGWWWMRRVVQR